MHLLNTSQVVLLYNGRGELPVKSNSLFLQMTKLGPREEQSPPKTLQDSGGLLEDSGADGQTDPMPRPSAFQKTPCLCHP